MVSGFLGFCEQFLKAHPDYYIISVRINGSAVESYFSQLKYVGKGQLSAVNYTTAQAAVKTTKAVSTKHPRESDCRDANIDIHVAQLKKRQY